ncbi:MAG: PEP-CTERM sorting domain-containing protein [Planctomycetota bacterium]
MRETKLRDRRVVRAARFKSLAFGLFAISFAAVSQAQTASFRIGENAEVVRAAIDLENNAITQPEFDQILMVATCQNPYARVQDRNRPFLAVINTSDNESITSVSINLEEAGFVFGDGDLAGDGFDGFLSMLAPNSDDGVSLDSASYGGDNTELQLNFSGLTPGQAAIFRVDIDEPGGVFLYPDYREAFQGANEGFGRNGDLANLSATFDNDVTVNAMFPQIGRLETAGQVEGYHSQTMTPPDTSMVPEPASVCLMLAGLCGLSATLRRR